MKKDDREIMEILEAFDLTGCAHSAAQLAGCDPKTVRRWVGRVIGVCRSAGRAGGERLIDPFLDKVEEWVDRSKGQVRADVVHERLVAVGFAGDERTTRRAVAEAKTAVAGGASAHVSAVDRRAGDVVPVRLGSRAGGAVGRRAPRATLLFCRGWRGRGSGW